MRLHAQQLLGEDSILLWSYSLAICYGPKILSEGCQKCWSPVKADIIQVLSQEPGEDWEVCQRFSINMQTCIDISSRVLLSHVDFYGIQVSQELWWT